jgi:hypothetical protein
VSLQSLLLFALACCGLLCLPETGDDARGKTKSRSLEDERSRGWESSERVLLLAAGLVIIAGAEYWTMECEVGAHEFGGPLQSPTLHLPIDGPVSGRCISKKKKRLIH